MMELIFDPKSKRWVSVEELRFKMLVESLTSYKELRNKQLIALAKGMGINLLMIREELEYIIQCLQAIAKALNVQLPSPPKPPSQPQPPSSGASEVVSSG